ncbi:Cytochrome c oxidase, subunit II [Flavobacterium indicum GPTSA100-9 = DSM 17447]|uniref:Cytochrome c oxidase subunit 2 n=1 Tax=Flavobacterium indicum (strain DSM 17447 / CIP 109464 / GPTSA100-9) TaxID=1094466 RepID=H8XQ37_FLAIG|nr:cytochrome c oxidase subunit II [Flavobacterium indicum]CCG52331.1 Cytochrome c oxidase, subunit II [Flavobacterium indicum GPTSA100-9 = DSM 17447]
MNSLLVLIIVVLLGVAIWQLSKIFNLTTEKSSDDSEIANDRDNNVNGYLMFAFVGFIYIFTIYSLVKWGHFVLGTPASEHGVDYDNLMYISMVIIFIVQTITQFLLHYFAFKYRGKEGQKALYFADNNKLEMIWTVIPVIVLAGLILYGLYTWNNIMNVEKGEEVINIELYAKQFSWEARYSGEDNTLGKANVRYIKDVNTLGVDLSDPAAQDDKVVTELHIPVGKKIHFRMRSQDVLHSAYMPHFRAQMNCVPGMVTEFAFTPTITTAEMRNDPKIIAKVADINKIRAKKSAELVAKGQPALEPYTFDYLLLCNKICGASHYNMQIKIIVESEADYKKWVKEQKTIAAQVKEASAPKVDPAAPVEVVVDSTKTMAQAVK